MIHILKPDKYLAILHNKLKWQMSAEEPAAKRRGSLDSEFTERDIAACKRNRYRDMCNIVDFLMRKLKRCVVGGGSNPIRVILAYRFDFTLSYRNNMFDSNIF